MIGQKLTKILQSLEPGEFKRLKRALSSPYFATNTRLLTFYEYLKKHYPDFEEEKLQKEKLFKKLYPGKPFNDGVLRVLVREFTSVVEDYIMLERLRSNKHQRKKMLVKEYGQRNLYDYFKKGTEDVLKDFDDDFVKDMEYYSESIGLYQDYCFHPMTNTYDASDDSLEKLMDSLDAYFVLAKYRFVQVLRNRNTILKKKTEYRFFEMIKEYEDDFFMENKLIALYELLNKLHDTNDGKYFNKLKIIFFPVIDKIRRTDCRIIFFMGLNFCARQINSGMPKYFIEQFEWYKKGLENKLLVENEKISDITFNNIVIAACYINDLKWVKEFIDMYKNYLNQNIKEDALNYATATFCIAKKDFLSAIHLLTNQTYSKGYVLKTRATSTKAFFEQFMIDPNYYPILVSHVESSLRFLRRNDVFSESQTLPIYNFIKIVGLMSKKIRDNVGKPKIKIWTVKKINSEEKIVWKFWLQEKVDQLV